MSCRDAYIGNECGAPYWRDDDGNCCCPRCQAAVRKRAREEREMERYDDEHWQK